MRVVAIFEFRPLWVRAVWSGAIPGCGHENASRRWSGDAPLPVPPFDRALLWLANSGEDKAAARRQQLLTKPRVDIAFADLDLHDARRSAKKKVKDAQKSVKT
jgi:hypothetical protein